MAFFPFYYFITPQEGPFSTTTTTNNQPSSSSVLALFFPKLFSMLSSLLRSQQRLGSDAELEGEQSTVTPLVISREDVETVMGKLGLFCDKEEGEQQQQMKLLELFDEKEPSLEEVKEAFDVFDANGDGFIDETELQRVMWKLGLEEGSEVESCRKMVRAFDGNGDGRIDFCEFVKFMDRSFC